MNASIALAARRTLRETPSEAGALFVLALTLAGCRLPPDTPRGATANVVAADGVAYATLAEDGIGVFRIPDGALLGRIPPAAGSASVDDLALADGLLFALDAKSPGHLSVFSLARASEPRLVAPPLAVPVGPFSGVSAAAGRVIVSGGTSALTVARYGAGGALAPETSSTDLGRGQPDVLIAPDGEHAFVSTHFSLLADTFGLTTLRVSDPPASSRALATLELDGAGFTPGGARPANFPLETAMVSHYLLVASGSGLSVVDVADASSPRLATIVSLDLAAVGVDARGTQAVVVGSTPAPMLVVLDVSQPEHPRIDARVSLPAGSRPTGVAIADGFAVVAGQTPGVTAIALPHERAVASRAGAPRR